uniref:Condensin complex subunit 2 n=1 Tax=Salix viminalis TaxID=40686 RepID=A0A6N2MC00_SALVM
MYENDTETNFQKILYIQRPYKVLGGINRAGLEDEPGTVDGLNADNGEESHSKKDTEKKISPLSTLEPSFEALNVKKFDVAFAVDPLYHQTSAQFDEGGAKGLLLNNLGVYGGCRVLFDFTRSSREVRIQ